jgi:adenylate cyclase class 2
VGVQVENEIKLRLPDAGAARAAVFRLGAKLARPRHLEDNLLFDDAAGSLRARGSVLRLRRTDAGALLTHKGARSQERGIKSRDELESVVADGDACQAILAALGFRPVFRYQKYREAYAWRDAEVVVDETPIGAFLEIEGPAETIHAAARAMGFAPSDYLSESYPALFFGSGGTGDMVFD